MNKLKHTALLCAKVSHAIIFNVIKPDLKEKKLTYLQELLLITFAELDLSPRFPWPTFPTYAYPDALLSETATPKE